MSEKFTLYDDSKYENHATNELPLASKNMSKKEEQSKAYIKPIVLDRNKKYLKEDNWELGLDYTDFTGYEVQCAFEAGWDACEAESVEIIKTAKDHAYFAGSEAMREKLINEACKWLEENADTYIGVEGYAMLQDKFFEDFRKAMEE